MMSQKYVRHRRLKKNGVKLRETMRQLECKVSFKLESQLVKFLDMLSSR